MKKHPLQIVPGKREVFLRTLHQDSFRELRAIRKGKETKTYNFEHDHLTNVETFIHDMADMNLYFGVATRVNNTDHDAAHCGNLYALFADIDYKDITEEEARTRLASLNLPYSAIVKTGGGLHVYWFLQDPIKLQEGNLGKAKQILRALAIEVGADLASAEPARILRLPGTLNFKYDPPRPTELEFIDTDLKYTLPDILAALPPVPEARPEPPKEPIKHQFALEARVQLAMEWLKKRPIAVQGQHGHFTTFSTCCAVAVGHDLEDDDAFRALREWNLRCRPPWSERELRRMLKDSINYATEQRGARLQPHTGGRILAVEDLSAFVTRVANQPRPSWLVSGLIPDEGICLWHGQPRDFKSMSAQEVALALSCGRNAFHNARFKIGKAVKVAYFTEEDPERLFSARMNWLTAKGDTPEAAMFFPFVRRNVSFDSREDQEAIINALTSCEAVVVFFDPLRSLSALSDKGPADLQPVTKFLRRIQNETAAKAHVLLHHDTKPPSMRSGDVNPDRTRSQQASGGGIFSISDCPVAFRKTEWNRVVVFPEDYKLSADPKPFEVEFQTDPNAGTDEHGAPRFGKWIKAVAVTKEENIINEDVTRGRVLKFLRKHSGWSDTDEVRKGVGLRREDVTTALNKLKKERLVKLASEEEARQQGRSSKAKLWSIAGQEIAEEQQEFPDAPEY